MAMPSFYGSWVEAEKAGDRCLECHWCGGWLWWPKDATEARVFHDYGPCQIKEGQARKEESGR